MKSENKARELSAAVPAHWTSVRLSDNKAVSAQPHNGTTVPDVSKSDHPVHDTDGFTEAILEASMERPAQFSAGLVRATVEHFGVGAASLYSSSATQSLLRLKAQHGFDYNNYSDFQLSRNTYIGAAVNAGSCQVSLLDPSSDLFRDKQLLADRPDLVAIGVVPIPLNRIPAGIASRDQQVLAMGIYGSSLDLVESVTRAISQHADFVARLYVYSLSNLLMDLRRATVHQVAFASDADDLADRARRLVSDRLGYLDADLYLYNADSDMLTVAGRERRAHAERTAPDSVDLPCNVNYGTVEAFKSANAVLQLGRREGRFRAKEFAPAQWGTLRNAVALRIVAEADSSAEALREIEPSARVTSVSDSVTDATRKIVVGVLRVLNLESRLDGVVRDVDPSWEDIVLLSFAAEMLAVLLGQLLRVSAAERQFERRLHGASSVLPSVAASLQILARNLDVYRIGERMGGMKIVHDVEDAHVLLEDLILQLGTFDWEDIEPEPIDLRTEVMAALPQLAERMRRARVIEDPVRLSYLRDSDVLGELLVKGHRAAVVTVFRNLMDNAIKYRQRERELEIKIEAREDIGREFLLVTFADNGIGIPPDEHQLVFLDAYRGRNARHLWPGGLGRGLADCDRIMNRLGGRISATSSADKSAGATFELAFRLERRNRVPGDYLLRR